MCVVNYVLPSAVRHISFKQKQAEKKDTTRCLITFVRTCTGNTWRTAYFEVSLKQISKWNREVSFIRRWYTKCRTKSCFWPWRHLCLLNSSLTHRQSGTPNDGWILNRPFRNVVVAYRSFGWSLQAVNRTWRKIRFNDWIRGSWDVISDGF